MKKGSLTETELIIRAGEDMDAFAELVERYRDSVQRQCYSRVRDWQHAEDLAQDTFVRAYLKLDQLTNPVLFPNWLRKIASNVCNEFFRSPSRRESATDITNEYMGMEDKGGEESLRTTTSLETLPLETRKCVEYFYDKGMSYSEIAGALNMSIPAVKGRLRRAKAVLRKELAELEPHTRSKFTQRVLDTLEQLNCKDPKEREQATAKLHSALAPDKVDFIVSGLNHPDHLERSYFIRPSRRFKSQRVRDALVNILLHDEWEENRLKAAGALVSQRDPSVIPYLEQAASAPENPSDVVAAVKSAIKQLRTIQSSADTEPETLMFRQDVEKAADDPKSRLELLNRLKMTLNDPDPGVRNQSLKALQGLGDRRAVPAIVKLLDDPIDGIREAAALALGELGGKRAIEAIADTFKPTYKKKHPTTAFLSLTRTGNRSALPHIMNVISSNTVIDGMQFAESVATKDDLPMIREALKRFAESSCPPPWKRIVTMLANEQRGPELIEDLVKYPWSMGIIISLARIGDTNSIAVLKDSLLSYPSQLAAEVLAESGDVGIDALREALRHPDPKVRQAACSGIASKGNAALQTELAELANNDPNSSVKLRAKVALRLLRQAPDDISIRRGWLRLGTQ